MNTTVNVHKIPLVIKKTMEGISFEYRRGVEEDTRDQMPKLFNTVEPEETKVKHEDNKKVIIED